MPPSAIARKLEQTASSPEEFYRSLEQELEVRRVTPMTLARIAQLTQKTNQFNTTTKRYSEQQIQAMEQNAHRVYSLRVKDRYADNGLVGVAILAEKGEVCEIDTLLLSCRVIGRTVETAFLSKLAEEARTAGATRLEGWFLPTKKNAPAKDFYAQHGFEAADRNSGRHALVVRFKQTGSVPGLDSLLMNVLDQVRSIAGDVLHVPVAKLSADSTPESIESWDSVQHLNLVLALESQFGIEFEPEEIDQMKSIGKIAALVERKQQ